jgi:hypothetical protein
LGKGLAKPHGKGQGKPLGMSLDMSLGKLRIRILHPYPITEKHPLQRRIFLRCRKERTEWRSSSTRCCKVGTAAWLDISRIVSANRASSVERSGSGDHLIATKNDGGAKSIFTVLAPVDRVLGAHTGPRFRECP